MRFVVILDNKGNDHGFFGILITPMFMNGWATGSEYLTEIDVGLAYGYDVHAIGFRCLSIC